MKRPPRVLPTDAPEGVSEASPEVREEPAPEGLTEDAGLESTEEARFLAEARRRLKARNPELYRLTEQLSRRVKKS